MRKAKMLLTQIHRDLDDVLEQIIDHQQIVGMWQLESEWGPRALGNRSILFDPRHKDAKNIVNSVKKRESYRPFACTVMLEHAETYFDMEQLPESPWMSFALQCKPRALRDIPRLVHADNTCRIQTVTEEQNANYYNLIKGFYERTGVPIIFNTSFNLGGESIVETVEDAIDTCNRSMINHLYIPEDQDVYIPYDSVRDKTKYLPKEDEEKYTA
jgi:carbamoyltransferase